MKKTTRVIAALGLIAVGVLGLAGLQAFGAPSPTLPTVPVAVAAPVAVDNTQAPVAADNTQTVDPALEGKVRDMLQERMGLSATEADKLAKSMAEHMQAVHGDQADQMVNACANQADGSGNTGDSNSFGGMMGGSAGSGMMGGANGGGFGGGMMGGGL